MRACACFLRDVLASNGDPTDPEQSYLSLAISASLHARFEQLSEPGRIASISLAMQVLRQHLAAWSPNVPTALETGGKVLLLGLADPSAQVKEYSLRSMTEIWTWDGADNVAHGLVEEWKRGCYDRASLQLTSAAPAIRAAAAKAVSGSPYHESDAALIALLEDDVASVRKAGLLALCESAADSLTSSHKMRLMDFLQDPDPEVVAATTRLLQACGVGESRLSLARLLKDPDPRQRATVAGSLAKMPEINPVPLLLTLSEDSSPLVRISAVRVALESSDPRLRTRLLVMSETDSDAEVRTLLHQHLAAKTESKTPR
ncbi:MAG: HEAT repeat domain-containing protein [Planctomycetota bacterium]